jgi:uncharacterized protein DUF4328
MSPSAPRTYVREPIVQLGKLLVALLAIAGLVSVIQAFQLLGARGHASDIVIVTGPGAAYRTQGVVGSQPFAGLASAITLAAGIVWLVWQHRGHANLRARGVQNLRFTPGWAVGWWFVPFANLVMPYLTMRELWDNAGMTKTAERGVPRRRPLVVWWFVYLASLLVTLGGIGALISTFASWIRTASRMAPGQYPTLRITAAALRQVYLWVALGNFVRAGAAALAIIVVLRISEREDAAQSFDGYPPANGLIPRRPDL